MAEKARGWFGRTYDGISAYFQSVHLEMSKVVWPTPEKAKTFTIVVIVATAISAVLMGLVDLSLSKALEGLLMLAH